MKVTGVIQQIQIKGKGADSEEIVFVVGSSDGTQTVLHIVGPGANRAVNYLPELFASMASQLIGAYHAKEPVLVEYDSYPAPEYGHATSIQVGALPSIKS